MFYGSQVEHTIPARGGRVQVLRLIHDLLEQPRLAARAVHRPRAAARDAGQRAIKRRSLVFVISDFISAPGWERPLEPAQPAPRGARRPPDRPARGRAARRRARCIMEDAETGEQLYVDTHDNGLPASGSRRRRTARGRPSTRAFRRAGVEAVSLSTDEDLVRRDRPDGGRRRAAAGADDVVHLADDAARVLLAIPLGVGLYRVLERRRRPADRRRSASGAAGPVARPSRGGQRSRGIRRRLPAALCRRGRSTILVVALARPQASVSLPRQEGTVILAFDVSGSMAADDLTPDPDGRGQGRRAAFVERQPPGVLIGVVAFSDTGLSVQAPTSDRPTVLAAIKRLDARARHVARAGDPGRAEDDRHRREPAVGPTTTRNRVAGARPPPPDARCPPGTHTSAVIVLLTDGENTARPTRSGRRPGRRGPRRPHLHGRHRQRGRDDPRRRRVQGPHPARRGDAPADLRHDRRHLLRGRGPRPAWPKVYDEVDTQLVVKRRADRGHLAVRRRRRPAAGPRRPRVARCGRAGSREHPLMSFLWPGCSSCCRSCRCSSACACGPCAGAGRPASATRACRSSATRCRARRFIRRHLPFALFLLGARRPDRGARPAGRRSSACPTDQTTIILTIDVSREHVLDRHPAEPAAGGRGRGADVHRAPGLGRPRSASSRSPASPRSSRRRRTTRRSCSTPCRACRPVAGRRSAAASSRRSTRSPRSTRPSPRAVDDDRPDRRGPAARPEGRLRAGHHRRCSPTARATPGPDPIDAAQQAADRGHPRLHDRLRHGERRRPTASCGAQFIGREPGDNGRGLRRRAVRRRPGRRRSGAASTRTRSSGRRRHRRRVLPGRERRASSSRSSRACRPT